MSNEISCDLVCYCYFDFGVESREVHQVTITIEEMAECLALPIALYPSFPFGRPQIVAYYEMFKDADITKDDLLAAVKSAVKDSTYFPSVAGIYGFLGQSKTPQPPNFNAIEWENPEAIPMPEGLKELISKSFNLPKEG